MKNLITNILVLLVFVQFTSCVKEKNVDRKEEKVQKSIVSDTIFDSKNIYYSFIKQNFPYVMENYELIYFKEDDIDLDGNKEAIVAFGNIDKGEEYSTQSVEQILFLRNDNGIINKIDDFGQRNAYSVELVSLLGKEQKYIYITTSDQVLGCSGFNLFGLVDNKIKLLFSRGRPDQDGTNYHLVDKDKDGKYDGYEQLEDDLYYNITILYSFKNKDPFKNKVFKKSETDVEIPNEYPKTYEAVLLQYISLRSLSYESAEVDQRLKLICKDEAAKKIDWNKDVWGEAYRLTYNKMKGSIQIEMQEDTNHYATATYIDDDQKQYQCQFDLEMYNDRWKITKVTITKNGEK